MKAWMGAFGGVCVAGPVLAAAIWGASESGSKDKPKPPPAMPNDVGFTAEQTKGIGLMHQAIVDSLDDLSPATTRRVFREKPDGTVTVEVIPPDFGASRIPPLSIEHGKLNRELPRPNGEGPYLYCLLSNDGAPMTPYSLKMKFTKWGYISEDLKMENETVLETAKDALPWAMKGRDYGVRLANRLLWLKPLKLTHEECLSCHAGMKVGDTVGMALYVASAKSEVPAASQQAKR